MSTTTISIIAVLLFGDLVIFGGLWLAAAKSRANRPSNVGRGRIGEGTGKPNYVSSMETEGAGQIEPLVFSGEPEVAWVTAVEATRALQGAEIVANTGTYLHAEVRSAFFKFVDDLELQLVPEEKKIHVKSASRVGHSDLGANRTRVQMLRADFAERTTK